MLVGFAPGGGTDTTARALTPKLTERLGQQVIVDNRPGAAGNIATDITTKAPPDGYTILMGTIAALAINPTLYGNLPFDPLKDLAPVTRAVDATNILVVHPSVPAKSVKELIALAKQKPLNGGSSGVGGAGHLALELFNRHARHQDHARALQRRWSGDDRPARRPDQSHFRDCGERCAAHSVGQDRALAVTTAKRSQLVPDLPTVAEAGLPGFEANNWYGIVVPARTPRAIIERLNKGHSSTALTTPDIKQILFKQGLDVSPARPKPSAPTSSPKPRSGRKSSRPRVPSRSDGCADLKSHAYALPRRRRSARRCPASARDGAG